MKQTNTLLLAALAMMITLSSCDVIGSIFKAGMWIGIILVVLVVGIILWIANKFRGRGRRRY
ncbi:phosphatidate cytidylyltransferase [Flaviaesturariibacter amylovorans]